MGTQLPSEKRAHPVTHPTQFLAHVSCGQMAGWISMPLGTEVNLGPGNIVLDEDQVTNQTLHYLAVSWAVHYIYIFWGSCPPDIEFCYVQNSLCIQVLHSPLLAALLHGTPAAGVSQI